MAFTKLGTKNQILRDLSNKFGVCFCLVARPNSLNSKENWHFFMFLEAKFGVEIYFGESRL